MSKEECDKANRGKDEENCADAPRLEHVQGSSCFDLGKQLAKVYCSRVHGGFKRTNSFYVLKEPITCTLAKWVKLAEKARLGSEKCCLSASCFIKGLSEEFGRDAYLGMLDFELYTLELHRQAKVKAARPPGNGSQSRSSSSTSTSSSDLSKVASDLEYLVTNCSGDNASSSSDSSDDVACQNTLNDREASVAKSSRLARSKRDRQINCSKNGGKRPKQVAQEEGRNGASLEQSKSEELPGRCTGFALASGQLQDSSNACAILAQSVDLPGSMYGFGDFDSALHLSIPGKSVLLYDCDGRLCPIGCNSSGLGVTIFCFNQTSEDGFNAEASLSVQCIVWELLLGHDSLKSAIDWLQQLPVPVMCGSALLIADKTGAVNVELSPSGVAQISEVQSSIPLIRANHPIMDRFAKTCGASEKAKRSSRHRQHHLSLELAKNWKDAENPFSADLGLTLLGVAKKVRTNATLACVCMDLINLELHVQFRERQLADEPELIEHISKRHMLTKERVEKILSLGAFRGDIGKPRLSTGEPAPHLIHWKSYRFVSK